MLVDVQRMSYVDNRHTKLNKFRWVEGQSSPFDRSDSLLKIDEPVEVTRGKRDSHFKLQENDFDDASDILKLVLN